MNNLVPFGGGLAGCYGVSWYLPNDMQFFLLLPCFVLLHTKVDRRASYGSLLALTLASCAYSSRAASDARGPPRALRPRVF